MQEQEGSSPAGRTERARSAAPDLHLLPPGAQPGRAGRAHAAHTRWPDDRRSSAGIPDGRAGAGPAAGARQAQDPRRAHPLPRAAGSPAALERLASVLAVIYLIYNEGYSASAGDSLIRELYSAEGDPPRTPVVSPGAGRAGRVGAAGARRCCTTPGARARTVAGDLVVLEEQALQLQLDRRRLHHRLRHAADHLFPARRPVSAVAGPGTTGAYCVHRGVGRVRLRPDGLALIAFRFIQGAGAALFVPQIFSIIQLKVSPVRPGSGHCPPTRRCCPAAGSSAWSWAASSSPPTCSAPAGGRCSASTCRSGSCWPYSCRGRFRPTARFYFYWADGPGLPTTASAAVLLIVLPLVLGHQLGWPALDGGSLVALAVLLAAVFVRTERACSIRARRASATRPASAPQPGPAQRPFRARPVPGRVRRRCSCSPCTCR